eukprot:2926253-Amphidinium_carterae.6
MTGQDVLRQERALLVAGTVLQLAGVTIATSSKTQQTIALSSTEAELYASGTTVNDVIYVKPFLHELDFATKDQLIPQIYADNASTKCLTQQLGLYSTTPRVSTTTRYSYSGQCNVSRLQHLRERLATTN